MGTVIPDWLKLARAIEAIAQNGLAYTRNEFDVQRYKRLTEIAAEIVAGQAGLSHSSILEDFQHQVGYATPKVDVRAAVIRDGKILLVQEKVDGRWSMSGGWADVGESPSAMVAREAWEESGYKVRVDKLIGVFDANYIEPLQFYHVYKMIFMCAITGGEARPGDETLAVDFFGLDDLPPLSSLRTERRMLQEVFAHHADPSRPAYFE
jgi:ADP-ribose pyrophosphatase YjhB (NUDIX family)